MTGVQTCALPICGEVAGYAARRRVLNAGDQPHQGRFPRPVGAADADAVTPVDRKIDIGQHPLFEFSDVVGFVDVLESNHQIAGPALTPPLEHRIGIYSI